MSLRDVNELLRGSVAQIRDIEEAAPAPGVVDLENPVYHIRQKVAKISVPVSPTTSIAAGQTGAKLLKQRLTGWTKADHKKAVVKLEKMAKRAKADYARALDRAAQETWGRKWKPTDYKISCVGSDEFSESIKKKLRVLCRKMTIIGDALASHRYLAKYLRTK